MVLQICNQSTHTQGKVRIVVHDVTRAIDDTLTK